MDRRQFLNVSARSALAATLAPLLDCAFASTAQAQSQSDYKALVCLFMSGGMDGNNLLIPMDERYSDYAAARGNLTMSRSALQPLVMSSNQQYGANPLMPKLAASFNRREAAFLANVGTLPKKVNKTTAANQSLLPVNMFSHASQIGEWSTSVTQAVADTGWAGRIADLYTQGKMPAVVSTAGYQLMGQAARSRLGSASDGSNAVNVLNAISSLTPYISNCETGVSTDPIAAYVSDFQGNFLEQTKCITDAFLAGASLTTVFPGSSIGQQLQAVAQMIKGRSTHDTKRQIFICVDGGYDTHNAQLTAASAYFSRIDDAVGSFVASLHELGVYEQVSLFSASDFGRSLRPNATNGSDHAWGNHHFIVGGGVNGGQIYGSFPSLKLGGDDDLSVIGTWIPTTSSTQYTSTMASWLGVSESDLNTVFPERQNFPQQNLGFYS